MKRPALLLTCLATLLIPGVAPAEARQKIHGTYTGKIRLEPHGQSWRVTLKIGKLHKYDPALNAPRPPASGRVRFRRRGRSCSGRIYYTQGSRGFNFLTYLHGDATGPCRKLPDSDTVISVGRRKLGFGPRLRHGFWFWQNEATECQCRYWFGKLRHPR